MAIRRLILTVLFIPIFIFSATSQEKYVATWESLKHYKTPEWFQDAKFGVFIHWGIYSVPAFSNEWYPRNMYQKDSKEFKHHLETFGPQSKFGYKDFIPQFTAKNFDAAAWVSLFKKAGAKYVVPVAEHHDGFAMYKTSLSKWNAFEMGPRRDVVGELAAETAKQGLIFGVSSHRIEHWWFMNGGRKFESDVLDPAYADFYGPAREQNETMSPEYMNDWLLRCVELVEKYKPQLFWFDWWIEQPALEPYRKSFTAYYYNQGLAWNKGVALNFKNESFPEGTAVLDVERGKLPGIRPFPWQTDDAIGNQSWGYAAGNTFKDAKYIIHNLIDIVSKNGNLLINIGPRPDGTITDEETQALLGTGKWLEVNGEAIYGTRVWKIFGEGPTESASGSFVDQKNPFTANDFRFTTKGETLYALALGLPKADVKIKSLSTASGNGKVTSVELLGSNEKVVWSQKTDGLQIRPSAKYPSEYAAGYRITFAK